MGLVSAYGIKRAVVHLPQRLSTEVSDIDSHLTCFLLIETGIFGNVDTSSAVIIIFDKRQSKV